MGVNTIALLRLSGDGHHQCMSLPASKPYFPLVSFLSCRLAGVVHPHLEVLHKIALHAKGIRVRSDTHKTACLYKG